MDLFTYLMAKKGHNSSVHGDLASYLWGKGQAGTYVTKSGVSVTVSNSLKGKLKNWKFMGMTSQTGEPTPDNPIPVKVVAGDNEVLIWNKNLFDGEIELGTINPSDGSLSSNNSRTRSKNFLKVQPNTTYTLTRQDGANRWVIGYTKNKIGITDGNWNNYASAIMSIGSSVQSMTFTTTATTEYIKWYDTNSTNLQEEVMIEEGATASPFEPFSNTYPINLGNIELCKIGDYQDYIYKSGDNWYKREYIDKVVFDGSEDWTLNYNSSMFRTSANDILLRVSTPSHLILSNYYTNNNYGDMYESRIDYGIEVGEGTNKYIYIRNANITTISDFKTWLSTHNTTVYYVLNEETDIPITDETLITQLNDIYNHSKSYDGVTNITTTYEDGNEQMILEFDIKTSN